MKNLILLLLMAVFNITFAQDYFEKKGIAFAGYDVTEYQNNHALKGTKENALEYNKSTFYFASEENKNKFLTDPEKYIPQYGGYCAYAISEHNKKYKVNPEAFLLDDDGKVYLFYNALGKNTLDLWNKGNLDTQKQKADANWEKINGKK